MGLDNIILFGKRKIDLSKIRNKRLIEVLHKRVSLEEKFLFRYNDNHVDYNKRSQTHSEYQAYQEYQDHVDHRDAHTDEDHWSEHIDGSNNHSDESCRDHSWETEHDDYINHRHTDEHLDKSS